MPDKVIRISGARQHNLQNVSLEIPREKLVVITGLSGSGKSSLAFDTLFAEGQRKYVESLSAYARQFINQMQKPDVDFIEGLSPAIAIEQRTSGGNPRSTIATTTEIYDYLRLLYSAVGQPHDPQTGQAIDKLSPQQIVDQILANPEGTKVILLAPLVENASGEFRDVMEKLRRDGFVRARIDGELVELETLDPLRLDQKKKHTIEAVVDRLVIKESIRSRLTDSLETALQFGMHRMSVLVEESSSDLSGSPAAARDAEKRQWRQDRYSTEFVNPDTNFSLPTLTPKHFSFNSHFGACPACHGLGTDLICDADLIIPDPDKSLAGGAVKPWARANKRMQPYYKNLLTALAKAYHVSMETPYCELPVEFKVALCSGTGAREIEIPGKGGKPVNKPFVGVIPQMQRQYEQTDSELSRKRIRDYMSRRPCRSCEGKRLKPEILAVTLCDSNHLELGIDALGSLSIDQAHGFILRLALTDQQMIIVGEVVGEISRRLMFLREVGLGYLSLDRESGTLSGGEAQRIRLATQIGGGLSGVIYVLDEPSIGLHQRDNDRLIGTLRRLRDLGNSVIVVEHDEDTIRMAEHIIDIGPGAGPRGGHVVAEGTLPQILKSPTSLTGRYLSGKEKIPVPKRRVPPQSALPLVRDHVRKTVDSGWLMVAGASENNLHNLDAYFPIGCFTCVSGVSGSGKSTLVDDILRRALGRRLYGSKDRPGAHEAIYGLEQVDKMVVIDQSPIGRTPRSNPATYTGAFGPIRDLFAQLPVARVRGYGAGRFSFNVKGGRCETCKGDGLLKIEMHFLSDVYVECEVCQGRRYNRETMEVLYKGRSIADVLEMTVDEAAVFFRSIPAIIDKLNALQNVGLGYLHLGQSATTLSGGEAQRIKLASELARKATGRTLYILDEPTTGLHFADIHTLLEVLMKLRDAGNSLIVIEHNLEVLKCADWIIDLGPEGGEAGGAIVGCGPPEAIAKLAESQTAPYLARML